HPPQLSFLLRHSFLLALPVLDVGARCIPSDDISLLVARWRGTRKDPAIGTIRAAHPVFSLERLPSHQGGPPLVHDLRRLIRMDQGVVAPAKLFNRMTGVLQRRLTEVLQRRSIAEIELPVGPCPPDHHRYCVDHELELSLRLLDRLLRLLPVLDIDARPVPSQHPARLVAERDGARHERAIRSVRPAQAYLELVGFPGREMFGPF